MNKQNQALKAFQRVMDDYNHGISINRTIADHEKDVNLIRRALENTLYMEWRPRVFIAHEQLYPLDANTTSSAASGRAGTGAIMSLYDMAPDWENQTHLERLHMCKTYLYVHGVLTQTDNLKVQKRMIKLIQSEQKKELQKCSQHTTHETMRTQTFRIKKYAQRKKKPICL